MQHVDIEWLNYHDYFVTFYSQEESYLLLQLSYFQYTVTGKEIFWYSKLSGQCKLVCYFFIGEQARKCSDVNSYGFCHWAFEISVSSSTYSPPRKSWKWYVNVVSFNQIVSGSHDGSAPFSRLLTWQRA